MCFMSTGVSALNNTDKSILTESAYSVYGVISKVLREWDRDVIYVRADTRDVIAADVAHLPIVDGCFRIEAAPGTARRHTFFPRFLTSKRVMLYPRVVGPRTWCLVSIEQGKLFGKPVVWKLW